MCCGVSKVLFFSGAKLHFGILQESVAQLPIDLHTSTALNVAIVYATRKDDSLLSLYFGAVTRSLLAVPAFPPFDCVVL